MTGAGSAVDDPLVTTTPAEQRPAASAEPTVTAVPTPQDTPSAEPTPTPSASASPTSQPSPETTTAAPSATPSPTPSPTVTRSPEPSPTSTSTVPVWSTPPTVTTSEVPVAMIVLALLVLATAAAALALIVRRARTRRPAVEVAGAPGVAAGGVTVPASGGVRRTPVAAAAARAAARASRESTTDTPTRDARTGDGLASGGLTGQPWTAVEDTTAGLAVAEVLAGPAEEAGGDEGPREAPASPDDTIRFCLQLGEAMIDTTAPVVQVQDALEHVARANGIPDVEVVALPTALVLSTPRAQTARTVAVTAGSRSMRLDQVQEVLEVADLARAGSIGPTEGMRRIGDALERSSPYSAWQQALGYVLSAAGLALVLGGSLTDVALAAALGAAVVGFATLTARWAEPYQAIVVLVCAFAVSTAVFSLARTGLDVSLLPALVAPLITFLPGALLTTGVIDLATRQMIAGAARLSAGVMMLVLLALGIVAGANLVGIPASALHAGGSQALGWVGAWVGVGIFGVGVTIRHSAQRRAVPGILVVLVVAYAGQLVGGALLGTQVSAFVGALAMTPVALVIARYAGGPPAMVSFLPAFWLLVPGALGLVGVTSVLGESTDQGLTAVVTAGTTMVAISLGVLTGLGAGSWVLESRWWVPPDRRDHPGG